MAEDPRVWQEVEEILRDARTIAVIGAHEEERRPACYVPEYMSAQGYRMLPVNPALAGRRLWGERVRARLGDLDEPVDGVNVFRRSAAVPDHLEEILAMRPRPSWVWLQLGIRHEAVAERLRHEGITVIQDRCLLSDHGLWRGRGGERA